MSAHPATLVGAAASGKPAAQPPSDVKQLELLKQEVRKLQHALSVMATERPARGAVAPAHGKPLAAAAGAAAAAAVLPTLGGASSSSSNSTASIASSSSGHASTTSSSSSSAASATSSSSGCAVDAPSVAAIEAELQAACAPLAASLAAGPGAAFPSPQDSAVSRARAQLLDLFVSKAHELLLKASMEAAVAIATSSAAPDAAVAGQAAAPDTAGRGHPPGLCDGGGPARVHSAPPSMRPPQHCSDAASQPACGGGRPAASTAMAVAACGSAADAVVSVCRSVQQLQALAAARDGAARATQQELHDTSAKLSTTQVGRWAA
jgi:hypothetical protein